MPVKTLFNGDSSLNDDANKNIFKAVQTFIEQSKYLPKNAFNRMTLVQLVIDGKDRLGPVGSPTS